MIRRGWWRLISEIYNKKQPSPTAPRHLVSRPHAYSYTLCTRHTLHFITLALPPSRYPHVMEPSDVTLSSPSLHTLSHSLDMLRQTTVITLIVLSSSFGLGCVSHSFVHVLLRYLDVHEVVNVVKYVPTFIRWSCQCASCAHPFCLHTQCRPLYTAAAYISVIQLVILLLKMKNSTAWPTRSPVLSGWTKFVKVLMHWQCCGKHNAPLIQIYLKRRDGYDV